MSNEPKLKIDPAKVVAENAREICGQFGFRYLHELAAYTEALENLAKVADVVLHWHSKFDDRQRASPCLAKQAGVHHGQADECGLSRASSVACNAECFTVHHY